MMPKENVSLKRIATLDGWRGIAILGVIGAHWGSCLFRPDSDLSFFPSPLLYAMTRAGVAGLSLFFTLSGFLITLRLLGRGDEYGRIDLVDFFQRRLFRLLPVALIYFMTLALLVRAGVLAIPRNDIASALFFFRNYRVPLEWFTGHFWSLSLEGHFYFAWGFFLYFLPPSKNAAKYLVPICILVGAWRMLDAHFALGARFFVHGDYSLRTDTGIDSPLWGAFAALLLRRPGGYETLQRKIGLVLWLMALTGIVAGVWLPLALRLQVWAVAFPVVILGTALHPEWRISRLLDHRWLKQIGNMAYSLYVWQQLFLLAEGEAPQLLFPREFYQSGIGPALAIVACASISYFLFERSFIRLGNRWLVASRGTV